MVPFCFQIEMNTNLLSFMRPFEISLWILIGICIHVIPVVIYLLDRFSPFSHRRNDEEQTALNLSQAVWFSWSVVLNSGVGESKFLYGGRASFLTRGGTLASSQSLADHKLDLVPSL